MIASEESEITGISEGQEEIEKIKKWGEKEKKKKIIPPIKKVCFSYNLIEKKGTVKENTYTPTLKRDIS